MATCSHVYSLAVSLVMHAARHAPKVLHGCGCGFLLQGNLCRDCDVALRLINFTARERNVICSCVCVSDGSCLNCYNLGIEVRKTIKLQKPVEKSVSF